MIISFLSQKGGVSKSTLARATSVAFESKGWNVHIADLDVLQQTTMHWSSRRDDAKHEPSISVSVEKKIESALKLETLYDLLVIDGRPSADKDTLILAKRSDLVVLATGSALDDLKPQLDLAVNFREEGVKNILFIVSKSFNERDSLKAIKTINGWGFDVSDSIISYKAGYSGAQDNGLSIIETKFKTLNKIALGAIQSIVNKIAKG